MCIRDSHQPARGAVRARVLDHRPAAGDPDRARGRRADHHPCLLYTSDAADERSSVDLGGRRILKKKNPETKNMQQSHTHHTVRTTVTT